ncbi:hypothetical protein [Sulfolobus spindle-shaped virus SSV19]|nr:hypothetical protein [Sulfolobus spindle-shaped virus SSV19]
MLLTEPIPAKYIEYGEIIDTIFIIIYLLFRKSKSKSEQTIGNRLDTKLLGYYLVTSAIFVLLIAHFAQYANYLDYYLGLILDSLVFYMGLRLVMKNE